MGEGVQPKKEEKEKKKSKEEKLRNLFLDQFNKQNTGSTKPKANTIVKSSNNSNHSKFSASFASK